jgi:secreted Zn-dependent insulinase-like peptidase
MISALPNLINLLKLLTAEYPYAVRDILVLFENAPLQDSSLSALNLRLGILNKAMLALLLNIQIFFGAQISITNNLILSISLHLSNEGLENYVDTIEITILYIELAII